MKYLYILFIVLIYLIKSNCFVSVGNQNAALSLNLYLNILDKKSSVILDNLMSALKNYCFKHIENNIVNIKIIPVIDDVSNPLKIVIFYLNALEKMESDGCLVCSYLKFVKAYEYFTKINKNIIHIQALELETTSLDFAKELNAFYPKVDIISMQKIIKNYDFERIYNNNMIEYKFISLDGPIVYINGVFLNGVEKYDSKYWEQLLNDNKGNKIFTYCENSQEFYNSFLV